MLVDTTSWLLFIHLLFLMVLCYQNL